MFDRTTGGQSIAWVTTGQLREWFQQLLLYVPNSKSDAYDVVTLPFQQDQERLISDVVRSACPQIWQRGYCSFRLAIVVG